MFFRTFCSHNVVMCGFFRIFAVRYGVYTQLQRTTALIGRAEGNGYIERNPRLLLCR